MKLGYEVNRLCVSRDLGRQIDEQANKEVLVKVTRPVVSLENFLQE